jgi:hypothetical protein
VAVVLSDKTKWRFSLTRVGVDGCFLLLGVLLGGIFGITLMLWIGIQFYMFPLNFMSTAYFIFGLCQAVTGFMAWMLLHREEEKSER